MRRPVLFAVALGLLSLGPAIAAGMAQAASEHTRPAVSVAYVVTIDGPIGPATSEYVRTQLDAAEAAGAELAILRIDTPGGLSSATREIVQAILASAVPVVGYVAPRGARAASAGTYILYATHIAAMAPATHLGAATPVSLGSGSSAPAPDDSNTGQGPEDISSQAAERRKVINDAVAFIRSLARQRQRNADWAEAAVRRAVTLTAAKALDKNVIDLIAANQAQLLKEIDGMSVRTVTGPVTLNTASVTVVRTEPDWQTRLLSIISQPTVAYLLLMIGIFGLLLEGLNPGAVLPGVVGGICLLVALYAFQLLPVNYAGLALIVLGVALMVGEMFAPSFGVLGLGGIAAFAFGSVMLMDTNVPGFETPLGFVVGLSIVFALLMLLVIWLYARARHKRVHTGTQGLIGRRCSAMEDFDGLGRVWLHGETWQARCDVPVRRDDVLVVVASEGLTVQVRPADQAGTAAAES